MKLRGGLAALALMSFVAAQAQHFGTGKQRVTTVARDGTRSVVTREVEIGRTVAVRPVAKARQQSAASRPAHVPPPARAGVGKAHPNLLPGYPNAVISSQDYGSTPVGQSSAVITLHYPFPAGGNYELLTFASGLNGFGGQASCSSTECIAPLNFTPKYPGLTTNAVIVQDQHGNVIYETMIYATGTAPQFGYDLGDVTFHTGVTNQPDSIVVGPDGTLYLTDASQNAVYKIAPDFSSQSQLTITGLGTPGGIGVDGAGTIYIADKTNNAIVAYNVPNGTHSTLTTSQLSNPNGVAVDGTGAVYVADTGNNRIIRIDNLGNETSVANDVSAPTSLAVDGTGKLFYADAANGGEVTELPAGGGNPISITTQLGTVNDIAVDAAGRIYVATSFGLSLVEYTPSTVITVSYGGGENYGIAVNPAGDVITTQPGNGSVGVTNRSISNFILTTQVGTTTKGGDTISNTGNMPLTLSSIAISGTVFTNDASSQCVAGTVLQPAHSCNTLVDFSPPADQSYQESYTVTSNSLNVTTTTDVDTLYGNGVGVPTSTTLAISPNPVLTGQTVTFTGTVAKSDPTSTTPLTGQLNFLDGSTVLGSMALPSGTNSEQFPISTLSPGMHMISVVFTNDPYYADSVSTVQNLLVTAGNTSLTTLASTPSSPYAGQKVTFTVGVSGATQTTVPTGTVTLINNNVTPALPVATITLDANGQGSFSGTSLTVGNYSITASYNGDANYNPSNSEADNFTISSPIATTTTLTVSPSTVAYGGRVKLTANVFVQDNLELGQVVFCDVTATFCNATQNLGIVEVTIHGDAVLTLGSGTIGTHQYTATFLGETQYAASTSSAQTVTVTGTYPTTTTIASAGTRGSYGLMGKVVGFGDNSAGPTGTVSFLDTSNANASLGSGALGASTLGFSLAQPTGSPLAAGGGAYGVATGDFNGDGLQDVVVGNYSNNTVSILLGNGDGTFQPQVTYAVGSKPERVLVADLNRDGNLDLIVSNTGGNTLSVLLGNGDGTFQTQVTYPCASPVGLGVMDINNDGFVDVVAGDYYANTISVLLGNGDGTLQAAVTYATGNTPQTVAEGDFNGDGFVDVAVGNEGDATVGIFLGNGDGTFQAMVTYAVGSLPMGVQAGDFNGDGKQDLAISNSGEATVSVLLGNGDGTFQAQVKYAVGGGPIGLAIADFNGDGIADITVGNTAQSSLTQGVLLGNGDGTFQTQVAFPAGNFPYGVATADFNGDGLPDIAVADFTAATATIFLSQVTQTATATANVTVGGGANSVHNVEASYPGDTNFSASVSKMAPLLGGGTASPVASTTALTITPGAPTVGQNVTFSVAVTGSTPVATGTVTLMNTAVTPATILGTITLGSAGAGSFSTTTLAAGAYSVVASYAGDANYLASMSTAAALVVGKVAQTITFGALSNQTYGGGPVALTATASSQLPVSFVVTGPAMLNGTTLTITGAGSVTVTASQVGNATYAAATAVSQSFTVAQAVLTATANNASRNFGAANPAFTYATTGFVNGDTAAVVGGSATLASTATATSDAGTYPITFATKALTATNYSFNYVAGTLTVLGDVAQTITFPVIPNHSLGDAPFTLSATASSGLTVSYAVTAGPATVAGSTVTLTGVGTVTIQATQTGNIDYAAATPVSRTFTVSAVPPPTASSVSPAGAVAGSAATTVTLTGANFTASDVVEANTTPLTTTFVSATTLTAVIPAGLLAGAGTLPIQVVDTATNQSSAGVNFTVAVAPIVVFTGPATATSGQQPMVTFQLKQPYAVPINCLLTLTFAQATATGINDPAVQFSTGGRTIAFTVPAGSTTTPSVQFQTGTVAGTATVTLGIVANDVNVTPSNVAPIVVVLPEAVPQVMTATVARTGAGTSGGLTVKMTGFSNTREVKSAIFHFTPTPGNTISDPDVTVDVTGVFAMWFSDGASDAFGSSFTYTQPFNLNSDPATIQSVTVTLVNGVGSSVAQISQ